MGGGDVGVGGSGGGGSGGGGGWAYFLILNQTPYPRFEPFTEAIVLGQRKSIYSSGFILGF